MYCSYCGKQLADDGAFCSGCGNRVDGGSPNSFMTTDNAQQITSNQQAYMPNNNMYGGSSGAFHCPRCKSTNLETISSTEVRSSSKGGFSIGKGCLGYLCLGPFGILCGACSKTKVNTSVRSKTAWVCKNCSHRFKDLDAINQELKAAKRKARKQAKVFNRLFVLSIVAEILAVVAIIVFDIQHWSGEKEVSVILAATLWIFIPITYILEKSKRTTQEIEKLEKLKAETKRNCYYE